MRGIILKMGLISVILDGAYARNNFENGAYLGHYPNNLSVNPINQRGGWRCFPMTGHRLSNRCPGNISHLALDCPTRSHSSFHCHY
jgi:hypothetical protein